MDKLFNNWDKICPFIPKSSLVVMGMVSIFFSYQNNHLNHNVYAIWLYAIMMLFLSMMLWKLWDIGTFFLGRNRI